MDVWIDEKKPEVMSTTNFVLALAVHLSFFLTCFLFARIGSKPKETVIPIDLTVVVNENLDGNENEPPPLDDPPPPPPPPEPVRAKPTPPPPPEPVETKQDAVVKVPEKPKKTKKELEAERLKKIRESAKELKPSEKVPEKKPEKPEPPKKTKEQLRQERLAAIRNRATNVKPVKIKLPDRPSGNGKTELQTRSEAEIRKLLEQGYKPGAKTQIATSEQQRCISLIREAFYAKWERPPWTDTLREMHLKVRFGSGGRVLGWQLVQSSSDGKADETVRRAAALVTQIPGLSTEFINANRDGVIVRFKVMPN